MCTVIRGILSLWSEASCHCDQRHPVSVHCDQRYPVSVHCDQRHPVSVHCDQRHPVSVHCDQRHPVSVHCDQRHPVSVHCDQRHPVSVHCDQRHPFWIDRNGNGTIFSCIRTIAILLWFWVCGFNPPVSSVHHALAIYTSRYKVCSQPFDKARYLP